MCRDLTVYADVRPLGTSPWSPVSSDIKGFPSVLSFTYRTSHRTEGTVTWLTSISIRGGGTACVREG